MQLIHRPSRRSNILFIVIHEQLIISSFVYWHRAIVLLVFFVICCGCLIYIIFCLRLARSPHKTFRIFQSNIRAHCACLAEQGGAYHKWKIRTQCYADFYLLLFCFDYVLFDFFRQRCRSRCRYCCQCGACRMN